jgi:hypothetical protein
MAGLTLDVTAPLPSCVPHELLATYIYATTSNAVICLAVSKDLVE